MIVFTKLEARKKLLIIDALWNNTLRSIRLNNQISISLYELTGKKADDKQQKLILNMLNMESIGYIVGLGFNHRIVKSLIIDFFDGFKEDILLEINKINLEDIIKQCISEEDSLDDIKITQGFCEDSKTYVSMSNYLKESSLELENDSIFRLAYDAFNSLSAFKNIPFDIDGHKYVNMDTECYVYNSECDSTVKFNCSYVFKEDVGFELNIKLLSYYQ